MARRPRSSAGGVVFHVLNRGNCRLNIFGKAGDFLAFLKILEEGRKRTRMRILGYCLMGNHWHLVVWPRRAKDLSTFMQWITSTHVRRWREHRRNVGEGHLYQGRFKSFPVQSDPSLLNVLRYVEANPLRAKLVERAEAWRWSSLTNYEGDAPVTLTPWPIDRPEDWVERVNTPAETSETDKLRRCINRGQPFGEPKWVQKTVVRLGLQSTLRDPWRPKKRKEAVGRLSE
jgi:putative transposase